MNTLKNLFVRISHKVVAVMVASLMVKR